MANGHENLIPMNKRTKDEARKISKKGGTASGTARRKKKFLKDLTQILLNAPVGTSDARKLTSAGFSDDECINSSKMLLAVFKQALKGNMRAAEFLRDMAGENPYIELKKEIYESSKTIGKDSSSAMLQLVESLKGD